MMVIFVFWVPLLLTALFVLKQHRRVADPNKVQFVLWNPATDEFVLIPLAPDEFGAGHPDRYDTPGTQGINLVGLVMTKLEMTLRCFSM